MSSHSTLFSEEEPQLTFQKLGAGSFATVFVRSGTRTAYKEVQRSDDHQVLRAEYDALEKIYTLCNTDSFFQLPCALGFYEPESQSYATHISSPPTTSRRRPSRPAIKRQTFRSFDRAVYAMERIFHLPDQMSSEIALNFYPTGQQSQPGPRLCRLYLGKDLDRPSRFFNSANFPLDVARYETLCQSGDLSPVGDVAYGMGEMIGRIHWRGGFDARDIEFVIGGDGFDEVSYFVIDFNQVSYFFYLLRISSLNVSVLLFQMRTWSKTLADVTTLVEAHYNNDPYFPRARPNDPLYKEFKHGYMSAYPLYPDSRAIANAFLDAIEVEQTRRDATGDATGGTEIA